MTKNNHLQRKIYFFIFVKAVKDTRQQGYAEAFSSFMHLARAWKTFHTRKNQNPPGQGGGGSLLITTVVGGGLRRLFLPLRGLAGGGGRRLGGCPPPLLSPPRRLLPPGMGCSCIASPRCPLWEPDNRNLNIYFDTKQQLQNIFFQTQIVWSLYKHQGFFGQLKLLNKNKLLNKQTPKYSLIINKQFAEQIPQSILIIYGIKYSI